MFLNKRLGSGMTWGCFFGGLFVSLTCWAQPSVYFKATFDGHLRTAPAGKVVFKRASKAQQETAAGQPCFVPGLFGKAIYLGGPSTNLFSRSVSLGKLDAKTFEALEGATLDQLSAGWTGNACIQIKTTANPFSGVMTPAVSLRSIERKNPVSWFVASAYIRGKGVVRMIVEDVANKVVYEPKVVKLDSQWRRVSYVFPLGRPSGKVVLKWVSGDAKPVTFELDGLMMTHSPEGMSPSESPWLEGGLRRKADSLSVTFPPRFPVKQGTLYFWFRSSWAATPEALKRNVTHMMVDGPYKTLQISFSRNTLMSYLGLDKNQRFAVAGYDWAKSKKRSWDAKTWHLWTVTWNQGVLSDYMDGRLISRNAGPITMTDLGGKIFTLGSDIKGGQNADVAMDQFTILRKAWTDADIWSEYEKGMGLAKQTIVKHDVPRMLSPTPEMASRLAQWKRRGLNLDDVWVAFLPSSTKRMTFPLHGKIIATAPADNAVKGINYHATLLPNNGRFFGTAAWRMDDHSHVTGRARRFINHPMKAYTIGAWVSIANRFQRSGIILAQGGSVNGFGLQVDAGHIVGYQTNLRKVESVRFPLTEADEGRWIHVVYVLDIALGKQRLFVDGKQVAESALTFKEALPGFLGWKIGKYVSTADQGFEGLVDEVLFWDKALDAGRLASWYEKGKTSRVPSVYLTKQVEDVKPLATSAPSEAGFGRDDIYLYASFDRTVQPDIEDASHVGMLSGKYDKGQRKTWKTVDMSDRSLKSTGRFGTGVSIGGVDKQGYRQALSYPVRDWPSRDGTIAFWFKPTWSLKGNKSVHWLWSLSWAHFMSEIEMGRVYLYAGNSVANKVFGLFGQEGTDGLSIKANQWYHYAATWAEDGKVTLYINGKAYAHAIAPRRSKAPGPNIFFGCNSLARYFDRLQPAGDAFRPSDLMDDLLILRKALNAEDVARLASGNQPAGSLLTDVSFQDVRTAFRRDEAIAISVSGFGVKEIKMTLSQGQRQWDLGTQPASAHVVFTLKPFDLSVGSYQVKIEGIKNGKKVVSSQRQIVVNTQEEPAITMAIYDIREKLNTPDFDKMVRQADFRYNIIGSLITSTFAKKLDDFYRHGLSPMPTLHVDYSPNLIRRKVPIEQWGQKRLLNGQWMKSISPFSEVGQESKRQKIREAVKAAKGSPVMRYLGLWDEYAMYDDVSDHAIKVFQKETGFTKLPIFKPVKRGSIVADNDPLARWIDVFGTGRWLNKGLARSDKDLLKTLKKLAPQARTLSMPSSGFGSSSIMIAEVYPYLIETPLGKIQGHRSEMITDWIQQSYYASVAQRSKYPLWMLPGWLNNPGTDDARPSLNVMLQVAIANGATGVIPAPASWYFFRKDMRKDFIRFSRFCHRFGPMLRALDRTDTKKLAVLWNPHNVMTAPKGWCRSYQSPGNYFFHALRLAGLSPHILREEEAKSGGLNQYEGVLLTQTDVMTRGLLNAIEKYAASKGKVFVLSNSPIIPKGAIKIDLGDVNNPWPQARPDGINSENAQGRVPLIRAQIVSRLSQPDLSWDTSWFACYEAKQGDNRYVFVINSDIYASRTGIVTVRKPYQHVYELTQGKTTKLLTHDNPIRWRPVIEPGGWRVYLLSNDSPESVKVTWKIQNHQARYRITLAGGSGRVVTGGWPVRVTLRSPDGKIAYERPHAMVKSELTGHFELSRLTDHPGSWTLQVKDDVLGRQVSSQKVYRK